MITKKSYDRIYDYIAENGKTCEKWERENGFKNVQNTVLSLDSYYEMLEDGRIEVVYRFCNLNLTFQDTNPRTYKTYNGAVRWLEKNGYERVA